MLARYRLSAALVAVGVALGLTTPAFAATTPTISAPAYGLGFGAVRITGTARPGATVTLIEAAYVYRSDMNPATDFDNGGTVTATANSSGAYTIDRILDTGFVFAVEADGLRSRTIRVALRVDPTLTASSTTAGDLTVDVAANLSQPGMPVHLQRRTSGGAWTTLDTGYTDADGTYTKTLGGQPVGATEHLRAYIEQDLAHPTGYADVQDDVWSNWTDTATLTVGSAAAPAWDAPTSYPAAPGGSSAPALTRAGDVRFSKIQFDAPGRDTVADTSLNGEWFRLTNRTTRTIDLRSWTVRDASGHTYTFGAYTVRAGKTVDVHTGRGTNGRPSSTQRYWGRSGHIWNNGGDTATLRSNAGTTIDSCRYTGPAKGYTNC